MSVLEKMQDYILESWLPTKLTILIAGSSISLVALSVGLPEFLQVILGHPLQEERKLLLRTVAPLSLLCLGTFWVLLLVLRHYKSEKTDEIKIKKLSTDSIEILRMIPVFEPSLDKSYCSVPFHELYTATNLGYTPQEIRYHIEQLEGANCVSVIPFTEVSLTPRGRALLYEKKLLC